MPADDVTGRRPQPDGGHRRPWRHTTRADVEQFIRAVRSADEAVVGDAVMRLSRSRPWLAPAALAVGALTMLFDGVKLLLTNWRLTLIQVLPAIWIWAALYDLKLHVLHDKTFHVLTGPVVIPVVLGIAAITAAAFYLNAVFAFAITQPGRPAIRPAFSQARYHLARVLGSGFVVGICLGLSTVVVVRWGEFWFGLTLSVVVAVMMICYVAVPSRLVGIKTTRSRRDKLTASAVSGTVGAVVCTPPYLLGRLGLLMLGSKLLFVPGIILLAVGVTLLAGATGTVKTVKLSARLLARPDPADDAIPSDDTPRPGP
jgi:hypothetical protein